ncbi:hypothetical protein B0T26DRAFT_736665 [Lasiosphaeria miniovina]|uniref:Uncharacterized protein n=1 Tax=Lasiosphaeria miniovina TaxID=1954250 RepID=A0AA40BGG9_9PEZI|nr:uncharacterized protein B0T26DRAFT_736665 [Lasiosphaeria miniovina]KAK0733797.1 hypothetical protein B0T26DRAFT_736665 [Lasiosphaeria miniovina]
MSEQQPQPQQALSFPRSLQPGAGESSQSGQPYKAFGQQYQYAETWSNPLPEIAFGGGGHGGETSQGPVAASQADGGADSEVEHAERRGVNEASALPPDLARTSYSGSLFRGTEVTWVPPTPDPWYKRVPKMYWLYGAIITVGTIGVILAILGGMGMLSAQNSTMAAWATPAVLTSTSSAAVPPASTTTASGTSTSSSAAPSSTTTRAAPTGVPQSCTNTSSFIDNIRFISGDYQNYNTSFGKADSAEGCCSLCYAGTQGCVGWLYEDKNPFTPCSLAIISGSEPGPDAKCPHGYAAQTIFSSNGMGDPGVAGMGPCSKSQQVNERA